MLAQGREVASQAGEGRGSCVAAETAGDFQLDLEAAQVALSLIVVEGDRQIVEERQYLLLDKDEPFKQVARGRLREASVLARSTLHRRRRPACHGSSRPSGTRTTRGCGTGS